MPSWHRARSKRPDRRQAVNVSVCWNILKNSLQSIVAVVEVNLLSLGKQNVALHTSVFPNYASIWSLQKVIACLPFDWLRYM